MHVLLILCLELFSQKLKITLLILSFRLPLCFKKSFMNRTCSRRSHSGVMWVCGVSVCGGVEWVEEKVR